MDSKDTFTKEKFQKEFFTPVKRASDSAIALGWLNVIFAAPVFIILEYFGSYYYILDGVISIFWGSILIMLGRRLKVLNDKKLLDNINTLLRIGWGLVILSFIGGSFPLLAIILLVYLHRARGKVKKLNQIEEFTNFQEDVQYSFTKPAWIFYSLFITAVIVGLSISNYPVHLINAGLLQGSVEREVYACPPEYKGQLDELRVSMAEFDEINNKIDDRNRRLSELETSANLINNQEESGGYDVQNEELAIKLDPNSRAYKEIMTNALRREEEALRLLNDEMNQYNSEWSELEAKEEKYFEFLAENCY